MACTSDEIAVLLKSQDGDASERTAQLKEALDAISEASGLNLASVLVEKLADGARDPSWRLPLGDSGLLEYVLSAVPKSPGDALNKQALRLIGNACADCDENRTRVVEAGALEKFVMVMLKDPEEDDLLPFAIAATLNLCVDCQPAQLQASNAGLSKVFVELVSGDRLSSCQSALSHIMTILELLCNQDPEPKLADPNTPALLLELATSERYDADLDSFMEICAPALAYLTFQDLQPTVLQSGRIELLQHAFYQLYSRFDVQDLDPDTAKQLKQVGDGFLTVFADISSLPEFPATCPLGSKPIQILINWLGLPPAFSHLQTAACLSLGNLSRSDESSTALLPDVQDSLVKILSRAVLPTPSQDVTPKTPAIPLQLTHAALSFVKNLAIAHPNKPLLGAVLFDPANPLLPRLWTSTRTQPQLQFASISLARLLLVNCPANVHLICTPLPDTTPSTTINNSPKSNLALLTNTAASADEDPIKIEAARAASLVCRALHSPASQDPTITPILSPSWTWPPTASPSPSPSADEETNPPLTRFYTSHAQTTLVPSLTHLLTQPRFPALRSETIFVLALMSRDPAGARLDLQVLQSDTNGAGPQARWQAIASAISDSDAGLAAIFSRQVEEVHEEDDEHHHQPGDEEKKKEEVTVERLSLEPQALLNPQAQKQQPARAAEMDRENAMVLVAELLRQFPDELASLRRPLEELLNKGGELVVRDRERGHK